jgi:hypothetical protein
VDVGIQIEGKKQPFAVTRNGLYFATHKDKNYIPNFDG